MRQAVNDAVVFEQVRASAKRMGGCDPSWLKKGIVPPFPVELMGNTGEPMLLLHGLFGALSNWQSVQPLMAEYAQTTAMQFPILTGDSSEARVKAIAAYVEFYIRTNFSEPVVLCGNSMGGHVAMRVALSSPELVKALVLSGTSGLYEHTVDSLPVRPDERFIRDHMKRVFFQDRFITPEAVAEILSILKKRSNHLNLIHAARSAKKDNLQKLLPTITLPTLLLWGEDDEVTTMKVAQMFKDLIPNSTLETHTDCGHAPMIEYPEWFAERVKGFLSGLS
jgi:2-hydroxy-6-oxonona-2,4-dienedioate hydrolase